MMAYNDEESDLDSLMDYMMDQEVEAEIHNLVNDDLADREHAEEDMVNYCKQGRRQIENNLIGIELNLPMDYYPHDGNWELFGEAVANNSTVKILTHWAHMDTSPSPKQFESFWGRVSTNQSIHTLLLHNYDIDGGVEFFTIMQQFLKRICTLELCENNIDVRGAQVFSEILSSRDCNLWKLALSGSVTSNNLWRATCSALNNPQCTLFSLDIQGADIDDECMAHLSNVLINSHLILLKILNCNNITTVGWQALSLPLRSSSCSLEGLCIGAYEYCCGVNNNVAISLANALSSSDSKLMVLNLATECLTTTGVEAFKLALQNPHSKLERLHLGVVNALASADENKAAIVTLCSALVNNHRLKDVSFGLDQMLFNNVSIVMDIFLNLLYNTSSIIDTYLSNHTLEKIEHNVSNLPNEVRSLLELNRNNNASVAARLKVLKAHFSDGNINPFVDMNCKVYPQAISWMAKDRQGLPLLYNFIRSMTVSFEIVRRSRRRPRDGLAFIASHNGRGRGRHMTIPSWITIPPDRYSRPSAFVSSITRLASSEDKERELKKKLAMEKVKKKVKRQRLQLMRPFDYGNL